MDFKKIDNEDKMLIVAGLVAVGVVGYTYWKHKKDAQAIMPVQEEEPKDKTPKIPNSATSPILPASTLNRSLLLKNGSRGVEVLSLQTKLGITADGIFGAKTEKALYFKKGVKAISLDGYEKKTTAPVKEVITAIVVPAKGKKLMAVKDGINIFKATKLANGALINSGETGTLTSFDFGEELGVFDRLMANGQFLLIRSGKYYFVRPENVKAF